MEVFPGKATFPPRQLAFMAYLEDFGAHLLKNIIHLINANVANPSS